MTAPLLDPERLPTPAMSAIALYMLVLSAVIAFGVLGHQYPPLFYGISLVIAVASIGLLRLFRWGWALTLAAVALLLGYQSWIFFTQGHPLPAAIMAFLNLIFFLYLVRHDVIRRLR